MNSSLIKKIILILALLLACAAGWYFLYWSKTPAYAAAEIQQALKKKGLQLFILEYECFPLTAILCGLRQRP